MKIKEETLRKIILIALGIIFIIGALALARYFVKNKKGVESADVKVVKTAFVDTVTLSSIPIEIEANGKLQSVKRVELYSEVQGVLLVGSKPFKAGTAYNQGQTLINIDGDEYYTSIVAARSNLYNLIASAMTDLKLDYPSAYNKWYNYLTAFNINNNTPPLPNMDTEQESYFINGKNIVNTYYNIKNLEERYSKYTIPAPFSGVLTEALVNPGALVRSGQKLGTFIDPSNYEMEVAIPVSYKEYLITGKEVALTTIEGTQTFKGKVVRINSAVDANSQTIKAFIEVRDPSLTEGQYLQVALKAKEIDNAYVVERKLLVNNNKIFAVADSTLVYVDVAPVYFTENTAVLKDVPNGTIVLKKSIPGAYPGMLVTIAN